MNYVLYDPVLSKLHRGTQEEIVSEILVWRLSPERSLFYRWQNSLNETKAHSYDASRTEAEVQEAAVNFLFKKLVKAGYELYIRAPHPEQY